MPSFNSVTLVGHVTRDPQIKQLPSGSAVAEFGLAMNHKYKTQAGEQREEVCFVDCAAFGRGAEVIGQYVTKGKALLVSGRLKYDQWEDKQGGKRSKLSVVVDTFQFLGGPQDNAAGAERPNTRPGRAEQQSRTTAPAEDDGGFNPDDFPA